MTKRISSNQASYLSYIAANPGCSAADVDRACRRNPRAGHKWVYDGVSRLLRRGILTRGPVRSESARGGAVGLYVDGPNVDSVKAGVILFGSLS